MPIYRAPVEDFRFLFNEVLELEKHRDLPGFAELSPDLVDDILANAGKFCEEVLQPLNQSGDEEGCRFENGAVSTPKGFKEAYKAYSEAGWGGLGRAGGSRRRRHAAHHHHGGERNGDERQPVAGHVSHADGGRLWRAAGDRRGLDEAAYRAQDGVGRMGRHHVPDRAGRRHRSAPDEDQGGGTARRHLQDERHQDFHLRRRPGPHRQHHPYGDRQDSGRERPDP